MPDYALAIAGTVVFGLTTWASLVFGYEVFQNLWETDRADGMASAPEPTGDRAAPPPDADVTLGEVSRPSEPVHPAARAASGTRGADAGS